jgi:DNA-binding response OmpR family regulator
MLKNGQQDAPYCPLANVFTTFVSNTTYMNKQNPPHLLIVEDENISAILLKEHLKMAGFTAKICNDGEEAWNTLQREKFELLILDVNMPKLNGFELAQKIRAHDRITPIIFLTANTTQEDKLKGFELGGDEYVTKPYSVEELIARIHAILRRMQFVAESAEIATGDVILNIGICRADITNHNLYIGEIEKRMSSTEAQLLKVFIDNKNKLLPRSSILLAIWGRDDYYTARTLDVYINKLRKLLKDDKSIEIVNIHGSGFKLVENISPTK